MSRPLRIEYEDAFYHVMNRGGGRQAIFHDADYCEAFLSTLEEANKRFGIEIHAYCLMSNHYHLLIKTPKANLSRAMRHINGVYTQRHNRMRKTDGALFRGRYKAILVDSDTYLLHLSKYIHRNPLEAKMVDVLAEYRWSSYPAYIGNVKPPPWLVREMVYAQVTSGSRKAARYQAFMAEDDLDEDVQAFYSKQRLAPILGDEDFVREASRRSAEDLSEVPRDERRQFAPTIERLAEVVAEVFDVAVHDLFIRRKGRGAKNQPRQVAMYLAQKVGDYRLTEIAEAFELSHYGGVSNAIHQVSVAMAGDRRLRRAINDIINRFAP